MINVKELRIGDLLIHNILGQIEVLGIIPHCGDYKITTHENWVYLKNCKRINKTTGALKNTDLNPYSPTAQWLNIDLINRK
jgi:hypothetical protein